MIILNKEHREIYSREVTREIPNSETISAINEAGCDLSAYVIDGSLKIENITIAKSIRS